MKMDKESLSKNRFWIGLIAFAPLWLLIFIVALLSSGSAASGQKAIVDKANGDLKAITNPRNERYTELVAQKQKALEKQKDMVWAEAWKGQKDLMKWPAGVENQPQLEAAAYFGDELSPNQRNQFRGESAYGAQLPEEAIRNWLAPNHEINADWKKLIHRVDFNKGGADKAPTNEEVWLAQEDVWVQQELISVVKAALDSASRFENVAHFKRVEIPKEELDRLNAAAAAAPGGTAPPAPSPAAPPAPAGGAEESAKKAPTVVRQRFHTPHWRLDLVLEQNEKKELTVSTQTALSGIDVALPTPGIDVRLWQNSSKPPQPVALHFEGGQRGQALPLAKAVPLPGFATNLDDLPPELDIIADKSEPPLPEGTRRVRYRNPNWELELVVVKPEGQQPVLSSDSKLTNINSTQRTLSLGAADFIVYQGNHLIAEILPPGAWLGWTKTTGIQAANQKTAFSYDEKLPLEVAQRFNPYTSPIKQINIIEIPGSPECLSFNSHRTANYQLKPATQFPVEAPKDAAPAGGAGGGMMGAAGASGGPSGGGMMGMPPMGGSGLGGTAAADANRTPNGINRNRYISVTEQVRHMPVSLSLIVEQAQLQDVLTAVTNSRLRIQITQVQWKRYEGFKPGEQFAGPGGGAAGGAGGLFPGGMLGASGGRGGGLGASGGGPPTPPGAMRGGLGASGGGPPTPPAGMSGMPPLGGSGLGGSGIPPFGRGGMGGIPPFGGLGGMGGMAGMAGGGGAATATGEQSDPNLIEVAVYGIAALYERYPPKPPKTEGAGGTPAPAGGAPANGPVVPPAK
jgi:hypothetical protein